MQSTIELLTKAAQQQTQDQRQQHQAVLQAQQQQMDALKLAFHKQAQELSALQSALSMVPASRSRGLQSYPSDSPEYMTQVIVTPNLLQRLKPAVVDSSSCVLFANCHQTCTSFLITTGHYF